MNGFNLIRNFERKTTMVYNYLYNPIVGWCFMVEPAKLVPAKIFYRTLNLYHVWGCGRGRGNFNWGRCGGGGGEVW